MPEEVIKIKSEPEETAQEDSPNSEAPLDTIPLSRVLPPNTSTVGRSVKLRDVFTLSGTVKSSSTVTTVTASVVSTTETDLASFAFQKNELHPGMAVRITALGVYTSDGTRTMTIRVGSGLAATTEWNSMASTAAATTDAPWSLTWYGIVGTIGSSGTLEAQMLGSINNVSKNDANAATVSIDTTTALTFAVTVQWSANTAGNAVSIRQFLVEILN